MIHRSPRRRHLIAGAMLVAIIGGLSGVTACQSNTGAATDSGAVAPQAGGPAPAIGDPGTLYSEADKAGGGTAAEPQKPGAEQQAPVQAELQQRAIIYTATLSLQVDDVRAKANQALDIASGLGGVVGSEKRGLSGSFAESVIVLRVPSDQFNRALTELAKLGTETARSVQTQDVTEQLVDLDARILTQRASVDRVRALLARAQTIGEIVSIESELTRREADLDSLEKRKASVASMVAMSTITVEIHGPDYVATPPPDEEPGFLAGLRNGWSAFVDSVKVVLVVLGWLLPWVVAIGLPIWLIVWLSRKYSRRSPVPTPTGADPVIMLRPRPEPGSPTTTSGQEFETDEAEQSDGEVRGEVGGDADRVTSR